jgi:SAM-dependent methyltransferase
MADVYVGIDSVDPAVQERLADLMETRAADPAQRAMLVSYTADLDLPSGARILEVGCGTGAVSRYLATLPGVAEVMGIDPSTIFVDRARTLAEDPRLSFAVGNALDLRLDDKSFDAVVCHTLLCHLPDCERALAEARRVLRPGGHLAVFDGDYVTTTVATGPRDPLQACVEAAVAWLVHDPWLVRRLGALLRDAGFGDARIRGHAYTQAGSSAYLLSLVERGIDVLRDGASITAATAEALKGEAHARAANGTFFGHIAYASAIARREQNRGQEGHRAGYSSTNATSP